MKFSALHLIENLFNIGRHELVLGNTFVAEKGMQPPTKEVPPQVDMHYLAVPFWVTMLKCSHKK